MNRDRLVKIEMLLSILIVIGIIYVIVNPYFILKGWYKSVLYVNDTNRPIIENLIKKGEHYGKENYKYLEDISEVKKIQFFLDFNDFQFTLYYKDGTTQVMYDDGLTDLKLYIEKNGYSKSKAYLILGIGVIIMCIVGNGVRKNISNKIDLIDKQQEQKKAISE